MPEEPVRLRPIEQADLDVLRRLDTDPSASEPFEWTGFRDPKPDDAAGRRTAGWAATPPTSPSACPTAPWPGS
jgi:hypothetical protein